MEKLSDKSHFKKSNARLACVHDFQNLYNLHLAGHPLVTVMNQKGFTRIPVNPHPKIYDQKGDLLSDGYTHAVQSTFRSVCEAVYVMSKDGDHLDNVLLEEDKESENPFITKEGLDEVKKQLDKMSIEEAIELLIQ